VCRRMTLKIYTKGERVLRLEALVHNTKELGCGRELIRFPRIVARLRQLLERFVQVLSWVDFCFIADETLEQLPCLTHLPCNDIPSGILSSNVPFYVQHTLFPPFATIQRISFSRNRAFVRCDSESARN